MQIMIGGKEITIDFAGEIITASFNELMAVKKYSAGRKAIWSNVIFWTLEIRGKTFVISNLTISEADFERYFYTRTQDISTFFPALPKQIL